jgi:AcrR family transcriptional regulator
VDATDDLRYENDHSLSNSGPLIMGSNQLVSSAAEAAAPSAHDQRRMHVLAAARSCFARSGFHGASMQQICAEAEMSPGALYRYFPSKEAIIEAIAEEERVDAAACVAALYGDGSLVDRITAVGMDYLRQTVDPDTGGLMVEIWSESIRNTALGRRFHEIEAEVRRAFDAALTAREERGRDRSWDRHPRRADGAVRCRRRVGDAPADRGRGRRRDDRAVSAARRSGAARRSLKGVGPLRMTRTSRRIRRLRDP